MGAAAFCRGWCPVWWLASYLGKGENRVFASKWREPVVHSTEWSTGFPEKGRIWANPPKKRELVVHSGEWTTSYPENGGIPGKTSEKARASGPLWKVDHWLPRKWRNSGHLPRKSVSQWSTLESGPLASREKAEIRHLPRNGGIPGNCSEKARASGPLLRVDHWLPGKWQNPGKSFEKA